MGTFCLYSVVFCLALTSALVMADCPPNYMQVERYGRPQCNRYLWTDLEFSGIPQKYVLPRCQTEGWTEWKMCLSGTLGPSAKKYHLKLMSPTRPLAAATAIYGGRRPKLLLVEFQDGQRVSKSRQRPSTSIGAKGQPFNFSARVNGSQVEYTFCSQKGCSTAQRTLHNGNLCAVVLNFQARISQLNLWCL